MKARTKQSFAVYTGDNERIQRCDVSETGELIRTAEEKFDDRVLLNRFVTRGLIEIQLNGYAGVDFNHPGLTGADMDHALSLLATSGVTCCLPTLITADEQQLIENLKRLDQAVSESLLGPLMVPGYHIEGPFLSAIDGYVGAHPPEKTRPASIDLVDALEQVTTRPIRIMTLAPEQDGVLDLIPPLLGRGIVCAIGHTNASRTQIHAAVEAGARLSTHLGNGLPNQLNKHDNPLFTQLGCDALMASFIADGIHIAPDTLKSYLRAKTIDQSILTSDAVAAAGPNLSPGLYTLGTSQIELRADGSVRIPGSPYLAGSSVTMDQMVRNLMQWYGYSMAEILQMAHENPSKIVPGTAPALQVGTHPDLVCWERCDDGVQVTEAHVGPWTLTTENQSKIIKSTH